MMAKTAYSTHGKRGVFLTLDSVTAMLILFMAVIVSFAYFSGQQGTGISSQILRSYSEDAATVMLKKGSLAKPLLSQNGSGTSGISEVLQASPASVCMQVAAYSAYGQNAESVANSSNGLVAYWKLDELSGISTADSSGNGHSGVLHGDGTYFLQNGIAGGAVFFDGRYGSSNEGYVAVAHDARLEPASITAAIWVKLYGNDGTYNYPLINWPGYAMKITDDARPYWRLMGYSDLYSTSDWRSIPYGKWNLLVGTFDNITRNASFYINGELTASQVINDVIQYGGTNPLTISSDPGWGDKTMNGGVDEVRIYNRALSSDEVLRLYSDPSNLEYVVSKPDCPYSGGETQAITVPFSASTSQDRNDYYYAVIMSWFKGSRA